jgi:hypothetical protein
MNKYFNLNSYEQSDLEQLIRFYKNFDGYHKIKLNSLDKLIVKEHKYGYSRMCPLGIWMLCGLFLPFWFVFMFLIGLFTNNTDAIMGISFFICFAIGVIIQILYEYSCDKIDYNVILNKNTQMNIFE